MANDEPTIHTGGGASVGRDAHAGRDFVGRDQINFFVPLGSWDEIRRLLFKDQPETDAPQTSETQFQRFDWAKAEQAYRDKVISLYDRVRILGTTADVPLGNIFTQVYILDKPTAYRRHNIDELRQMGFERSALQGQPGKRIAGIEMVKGGQNLFILGKPGAGKTTFLKYITLEAARNQLPRIPIFVSLNEWADSPWGSSEKADLMPFIVEQFAICGFPAADLFIDFLLTTGRALLLFDGLDEVRQEQEQRRRLTRLLQDFARKYDKSQHLITCRNAASDYAFAGFADVEVADFTPEQVEEYARHWFGENEKKFAAFTDELARPENRGLAELANTPLLLSMLCLTFDNAMRFPPNRAELYEDALDALLRKWDSSRQIQRDEIYRALSPKRKRHLLMSIAVPTFEKGDIFFRQRDVEGWIVDYLARLPDAPPADTINGAAILKAMEAQHSLLVERALGIYSFSHLTFQEYLTASYLAENQGRGVTDRAIRSHLTDSRWREVFLLTAILLDDADDFLATMTVASNGTLAHASKLIDLMHWAEGRIIATHTPKKRRAAVRVAYAFHALARGRAYSLDFTLVDALDPALARALALARAFDFALVDALDPALTRVFEFTRAVARSRNRALVFTHGLAHELALAHDLAHVTTAAVGFDYGLYYVWSYATLIVIGWIDRREQVWQTSMKEFSQLVLGVIRLAGEAGLTEIAQDLHSIAMPGPTARWQEWQQYSDILFAILCNERELGREWGFSERDMEILNDYFYAQELLVQCLRVAVVSDRQAILAGLLSPP